MTWIHLKLQVTSYNWNSRRLQNRILPEITVEQFSSVSIALKTVYLHDLIVFNGAPHATTETLDIAKNSDILILPSGISLDDLEPTVKLAHELKQKNIKTYKIAILFCRVGGSTAEIKEAKEYIKQTGYYLLSGELPERTAYSRASDTGRAISETSHKSLNEKADKIMQSIINRIQQIENRI